MNITGTFEVSLKPLDLSVQGADGIQLGRMAINKTFSGDLNATSQGEMLSAMTATPGSAGYVAMEQVTGTLDGKHGSFVLQHFGVMHKGGERLVLEVVPASGTGGLTGLAGSMQIKRADGVHSYEFDYTLN
jgi:Protein of unknown function (DUF3224)